MQLPMQIAIRPERLQKKWITYKVIKEQYACQVWNVRIITQ